MQKHVNLVDLIKSFPTNILLQNLASIEKRMSPLKFDHLAEKSEHGSISNLSTKLRAVVGAVLAARLLLAYHVDSLFDLRHGIAGRKFLRISPFFLVYHLLSSPRRFFRP